MWRIDAGSATCGYKKLLRGEVYLIWQKPRMKYGQLKQCPRGVLKSSGRAENSSGEFWQVKTCSSSPNGTISCKNWHLHA